MDVCLHRHVLGVGDVVEPRPPRHQVPDVAVSTVRHGAGPVSDGVHAIRVQVGQAVVVAGVVARERDAVHPVGRLDPGDREHGGGEVLEGDDTVVDAPAFHRRRPADDERHPRPGVVDAPLAPGEADPVVAEDHHDGLLEQAGVLELGDQCADLSVHRRDVVVGPGEIRPRGVGVGQVGGHGHVGGIADPRLRFPGGEGPALVGHAEVEHREERLVEVAPTPPVGSAAREIPGRRGRLELVVGLRAVRAEPAVRPQQLGEAADRRRRHRLVVRDPGVRLGVAGEGGAAGVPRPHVHRSDPRSPASGDQRRAARRADRRGREGVDVPDTLAGETVDVGGRDGVVAPASEPGAHVLDRDPHDVRGAGVDLVDRRGTGDQREQQGSEGRHVRRLASGTTTTPARGPRSS